MLYVFYGTDTNKVADEANRIVAALRAKRPDALVYTFDAANFEGVILDELVNARGLFVEKHVVLLKGVFEKADTSDMVLARVEQCAGSENIFVLAEGALPVAHKRALEPHATKMVEHKRPAQARRQFDECGLVAALKKRSRRHLWEAYLRARRAGDGPEAIAGLLHWGVKDMLGGRLGAGVYTQEELRALSRGIIACYHEAHRGTYQLDVALERWVLSV